MPPFCHMEKESAHPGTFIRKHPKATEPYHQAKGHISIHPGQLESPFFSRLCCTSKVKRYKCCNSQQADGGCVERWACCRRPLDNDGCQIRHECCQLDIGTPQYMYLQFSLSEAKSCRFCLYAGKNARCLGQKGFTKSDGNPRKWSIRFSSGPVVPQILSLLLKQ
jgi:hypothetical protein